MFLSPVFAVPTVLAGGSLASARGFPAQVYSAGSAAWLEQPIRAGESITAVAGSGFAQAVHEDDDIDGSTDLLPAAVKDGSGKAKPLAQPTTPSDTQPVSGPLTDTQLRASAVPVSLASVPSHAVTNAGTFAVQVDGAALTALQLIDDTVFSDDAAFTVGTSKVLGVGCVADETSTDSVDEGDIGAARMTLDRKTIVTPYPHTAGGLSIFRSIDLDESEEEAKASAGQLYGWYIFNAHTATLYVKLYNATAANVTVGTTTPVMTIPVPAGAAANVIGTHGIVFDTAITAAATTGIADNDTGAPGANLLTINLFYK